MISFNIDIEKCMWYGLSILVRLEAIRYRYLISILLVLSNILSYMTD